ncbi:hypothetical protein CCP3SC1AL1_520025 [Gammaproteobacteria bacterium]
MAFKIMIGKHKLEYGKKTPAKVFRYVGEKNGLKGAILRDYANFMEKAFPKEMDEGYMTEWVFRFKRGFEWHSADGDNKKLLLKVNPEYYKGWEEKSFYKAFPDKNDVTFREIENYMKMRK